MGRIEEIKERWKDFKDHDVNYLLSRLQIAEEALDDIAFELKVEPPCIIAIKRLTNKALERMQKKEPPTE